MKKERKTKNIACAGFHGMVLTNQATERIRNFYGYLRMQ